MVGNSNEASKLSERAFHGEILVLKQKSDKATAFSTTWVKFVDPKVTYFSGSCGCKFASLCITLSTPIWVGWYYVTKDWRFIKTWVTVRKLWSVNFVTKTPP
jgi:hypothetical protein